jgi:hypothetical protein
MTNIIILVIGTDCRYNKFVLSEEVENRETVRYSTNPNRLGHCCLVPPKLGSTQWEVTSGVSSMIAQNMLCASCLNAPRVSGRTILL